MVMKLQFKYQQFQADAAKAVVDIFEGQPKEYAYYMADPGDGVRQLKIDEGRISFGWGNKPITLVLLMILLYSKMSERFRQRIRLNAPMHSLVGLSGNTILLLRWKLVLEKPTHISKPSLNSTKNMDGTNMLLLSQVLLSEKELRNPLK